MVESADYLVNVLAALRGLPDIRALAEGPPPEHEDDEDWYEARDEAASAAETRETWRAQEMKARHEDRIENYDLYVEALIEDADHSGADDANLPSPPNVVVSEISEAAALRADLDAYIKSLIVFAGSGYAVEDYSQSELARLAGVTRQTVARWLADAEALREVRDVVKSKAAEAVAATEGEPVTDRHSAMRLGLLRWYADEGQGSSA